MGLGSVRTLQYETSVVMVLTPVLFQNHVLFFSGVKITRLWLSGLVSDVKSVSRYFLENVCLVYHVFPVDFYRQAWPPAGSKTPGALMRDVFVPLLVSLFIMADGYQL